MRELRVADADEGSAEDEDRHALEDEQAAERDDERRHLQPGHHRSLDEADRRTGEQGHDDRRPPRPIGAARLHELGRHDSAEHHHEADGEVDLAEEQGEDLGHGKDHVHGALLEQVDQVLWRQELPVGDLEADRHHDDGKHHGQHAAVATSDPEPPAPQVFAERLGKDRGRDGGHRHAGRGGEVHRRPGAKATGRRRLGARHDLRHGSRSRCGRRAGRGRRRGRRRATPLPGGCTRVGWRDCPAPEATHRRRCRRSESRRAHRG